MTTGVTPHFRAASIFSLKPPMFPDILVTIYDAPVILSMASFISSVKGPCMAMILPELKPASSASLKESSRGRTLAQTLSLKPFTDE